MLSKALCSDILARAMSTGADFAELYQELTRSNAIRLISGKIDAIDDTVISGVGIRAFLGTRTVYATTTDLTREGLLRCASAVADTIAQSKAQVSINLTERIFPNIHGIKRLPGDAPIGERIGVLKEACFAAKEHDERIVQVQGNLISIDHSILVANSEELYTTDRHVRTRLAVSAIASNGSENQSGFFGPGRAMGMEMFESVNPEETGKRAARQAIVNLGAVPCPAGQMPVAIENGFGGVIFNEACGHSLEATSVAIGASQMCGKLGTKIANEKVTAIDDGTIPNAWGSINIDDEGHPSQKNVLIENGVLKTYLHNRETAKKMGVETTANASKGAYHSPIGIMPYAFSIDAGDKTLAELFSMADDGIYITSFSGLHAGANPVTGDFSLQSQGFLIKDGKRAGAVKGFTLAGNFFELLKEITALSDTVDMGVQTSITAFGAPCALIPNMSVAGE